MTVQRKLSYLLYRKGIANLPDDISIQSNCEVPDLFFIFVRSDLFIAKWNSETVKTFVSAAFGELELNPSLVPKYIDGTVNYLPFRYIEPDIKTISPYCLSAMTDIRIETDAELIRMSMFPLAPSRLSSIYAFADDSTVQKASLVHGWDINTVKRVKLNPSPLTRVWKANMEIVSLMRNIYPAFGLDSRSINEVWRAYWACEGNIQVIGPNLEVIGLRKRYESGVTWEYLIEGRVTFLD